MPKWGEPGDVGRVDRIALHGEVVEGGLDVYGLPRGAGKNGNPKRKPSARVTLCHQRASAAAQQGACGMRRHQRLVGSAGNNGPVTPIWASCWAGPRLCRANGRFRCTGMTGPAKIIAGANDGMNLCRT